MPHVTLELHIRPTAGVLTADATLRQPGSQADSVLARDVPLALDDQALLPHALDPDAYGRTLTAQLFADQRLADAWRQARALADGANLPLVLRLRLADEAQPLHALRWETLRDPLTAAPLATDARVRLVRLLDSADTRPIALGPRPSLSALLVVANPHDLGRYGMAEIDGDGEVGRVRAALGDIPLTVVGDVDGALNRRATIGVIREALRQTRPTILCLICHGKQADDDTTLWLEDDQGNTDRVAGHALAALIAQGDAPLLLAVLIACEGGGALAALGPRLAQAGVGAVLAMQDRLSMRAAKLLLPVLFAEFAEDGRIDRAVSLGRAALHEGDEWWIPVLWLRVREGRLWQGEDAQTVARRQRLALARSRHSQERFAELRQGFVGRQAELAAIRGEVNALRATGGYLLVTGVAGQGKSSVLAALIAELGAETTPSYFIRFSPGADEQIALLRHLVAELLIQHSLEELADGYLPETAIMDTLANSLAMMLDRISAAGRQATLVIDGLDQIKPHQHIGERNLAFLPEKLPAGVVILIGTRPDDTLKPLKVLASQCEYKLPPLSLDDFAALLELRGAPLAPHERLALYDALHGNAFDLAFVVREIAATATAEVPALLDRVRQNPQDIFTPALDRLKGETLWRRAIRPILGCLLAATDSEPLSEDALGAILNLDTDEVSEAILRLRGFLGETDRSGRAYFYLYHLKLIDYLKGVQGSAGARIFSTRDVEQYHGRIVAWCEIGGLEIIWQDAPDNALEQERRGYTRQHYIVHLAAARAYDRLWSVIDTGRYGTAKRRHDPSTRSYALDLDIAREAVIDAAGSDADAQARALPRLWKYSLLRCSLTSQVDKYPEELFLALVALGRTNEAINLAELLSDQEKRANTLRVIGTTMLVRGINEGISVLRRNPAATAATLNGRQRAEALSTLAQALAQAQHWDAARATVDAISDERKRAEALSALAQALAQSQHWDAARTTVDTISDHEKRAETLCALISIYTQAGQISKGVLAFAEARSIAVTISNNVKRATHLMIFLARSAAEAGLSAEGASALAEAYIVADDIDDKAVWMRYMRDLAAALEISGQPASAAAIFAKVRDASKTIRDEMDRAESLCDLALACHRTGYAVEAVTEARAAIDSIVDRDLRARAREDFANGLTRAGMWREALSVATLIPNEEKRSYALARIAEKLAQVGLWQDARAVADTIPSVLTKESVLGKLAITFAEMPAQARAVAMAITDAQKCAEVLCELIAIFARASLPDEISVTFAQARAATDQIRNTRSRAKTLCIFARVLADAGRSTDAAAIFADARTSLDNTFEGENRSIALKALAIVLIEEKRWDDAQAAANLIPDEKKRTDALLTLTQALAHAGQWQKAHANIYTMPDSYEKDQAIYSLARSLALAGYWADAHVMIGFITYAGRRAYAILTLAESLYQAGHTSDSTAAFAEARAATNIIKDKEQQARALSALAIAQLDKPFNATATIAEACTAIYAIREARSIHDSWAVDNAKKCTKALIDLAIALTQAGHIAEAMGVFAEARAVSDSITRDQERLECLRKLVVALGRTGRWAEAHAIIHAVHTLPGSHKNFTLRELAVTFAQTGLWAESRAITDALPENWRVNPLCALAQALALAGHIDAAKTTITDAKAAAKFVSDQRELFYELINLAQALALAEQASEAVATIAKANTIIDSISNDGSRIAPLRALAKVLSQMQYWKEARAVADSIPHAESRINTLSYIAKSLAQAGLLPQSTALFADIWRRAQTRDELLGPFAVPSELLRVYPELGREFLDSFAWVDAQLAVG